MGNGPGEHCEDLTTVGDTDSPLGMGTRGFQAEADRLRVQWYGFADSESGVWLCDVRVQEVDVSCATGCAEIALVSELSVRCNEGLNELRLSGLQLVGGRKYQVAVTPVDRANNVATCGPIPANPVSILSAAPTISAAGHAGVWDVALDATPALTASLRPGKVGKDVTWIPGNPLAVQCNWNHLAASFIKPNEIKGFMWGLTTEAGRNSLVQQKWAFASAASAADGMLAQLVDPDISPWASPQGNMYQGAVIMSNHSACDLRLLLPPGPPPLAAAGDVAGDAASGEDVAGDAASGEDVAGDAASGEDGSGDAASSPNQPPLGPSAPPLPPLPFAPPPLCLSTTTRYHCVVRAFNWGGRFTTVASDGFYFDPTPPKGGEVALFSHNPLSEGFHFDLDLAQGRVYATDPPTDQKRGTWDTKTLRVGWRGFNETNGANTSLLYYAGFDLCSVPVEDVYLFYVGTDVQEHTFDLTSKATPQGVRSELEPTQYAQYPCAVQPGGLSVAGGQCELIDDRDYCAVVQAVNEFGLRGERRKSAPLHVCSTPPTAGAAHDDAGYGFGQSPYQTNTNRSVSWTNWTAPACAAMATYGLTAEVLVGSEDRASQRWEIEYNATTSIHGHHLSFHLTNGVYRLKVCGYSRTGAVACAPAFYAILDVTPPVIRAICIAGKGEHGDDEQCSSNNGSSAILSAAYPAHIARWIAQDPESGINYCRWAVGSAVDLDNISPWQDVLWADEITLPAATGPISQLSLFCRNRAGFGVGAHRTLIRDSTAPSVALGAICLEGVVCADQNTTLLAGTKYCLHPESTTCYVSSAVVGVVVDRSLIQDAESGIRSMSYFVLPDHRDSRGVSLPVETSNTSSTSYFSATPGVSYRVELRAVNGARIPSSQTVLFMADPHPPGNGQVGPCDARGKNLTHQNQTDELRICYSHITEPHSRVAMRRVVVRNEDTQAQGLQARLPHHSSRRLVRCYVAVPRHRHPEWSLSLSLSLSLLTRARYAVHVGSGHQLLRGSMPLGARMPSDVCVCGRERVHHGCIEADGRSPPVVQPSSGV